MKEPLLLPGSVAPSWLSAGGWLSCLENLLKYRFRANPGTPGSDEGTELPRVSGLGGVGTRMAGDP